MSEESSSSLSSSLSSVAVAAANSAVVAKTTTTNMNEQQQEEESTFLPVLEKSASRSTVTSSSLTISTTTNSSIASLSPGSSLSSPPASFTTRKRPSYPLEPSAASEQQQQQPQQQEGAGGRSPLYVFDEQQQQNNTGQRQSPSLSTSTANHKQESSFSFHDSLGSQDAVESDNEDLVGHDQHDEKAATERPLNFDEITAERESLMLWPGLDAPSASVPDHDDALFISTSATMDLEMGFTSSPQQQPPRTTSASASLMTMRPPLPNNRQRFYTSPSGSISSSTISTASSFRSRRRPSSPSRHQQEFRTSPTTSSTIARNVHTNPSSATNNNNNNNSTNNNGPSPPSLRASLDAGMLAVRNWIRARGKNNNGSSHMTEPTTNTVTVFHARTPPRPQARPNNNSNRNRRLTWQAAPHNSTSSIASEELDDLLQLDDISTYTNHSTRTEDDNSSSPMGSAVTSSSHRPASAPTVPSPYPRQHNHRNRRSGGGGGGGATSAYNGNLWSMMQQHDFYHPQPDTILEELDEGGADAAGARQRSQSEPDGRCVPDFFLGPVPSICYHLPTNTGLRNSTTPRQRRRRPLRNAPAATSLSASVAISTQYDNLNYHPSSPRYQHVGSPGRRINPLPRRQRPPGENEQLSSSAAAALYDSTNQHLALHNLSSSTSSLMQYHGGAGGDTSSDAGASVATTATVPASTSAFEMTVLSLSQGDAAAFAPISPLSSSTAVAAAAATPNNTNSRASPAPDGMRGNSMVGGGGGGVAAAAASTANARGSASEPSNASPAPANASAGASSVPASARGQQSQVTDAERQARIRWIRINRRFQFVITVVALLFSLLLFAILICWVVLTSAYVLNFDNSCDVPLKRYFWLVTLQLVLDVFRSDIMRFVFQWDTNSNQRIPFRVVAYNITYLVYALLVLRLGIHSIYLDRKTCHKTAPELYSASAAFVSLSVAAWATIICGYLLPFCVVAGMLTCNGYSPMSQLRTADENMNRDAGGAGTGTGTQPVFPAAYATTGAPPGTVDRLAVARLENIAENSRECCICMEDFATTQDVLVETCCKHVFHKHCCREWLRQARTCPVCRTDIPGSLQQAEIEDEQPDASSRIPIGPTGRPVVGLFRILRRTTGSIARTMSMSSPGQIVPPNSNNNRNSHTPSVANDARTGS